MKLSRGQWVSLMVVVLLAVDQVIKIAVKLNMTIGESIHVLGDWFQICFIENNGMAFGMQLGGMLGKLALTSFRVVLIGVLIYYLRKLVKRADVPAGVLAGCSLILVGAIGNVIDCLFYGVLFNASTYTQVAQFLPEGGGYAPMLFGKVVDMFYFPLIESTFPSWFPIWGGEDFIFFRPIFNFADSCITVGVAYLLFFQNKFFSKEL